MKIVVLDAHALNPGDLIWDAFQALGEVTLYDRTGEEDILERAQGADILLTNKTPLSRETIEKLPDLKYVGVLATGFNIVDIEACKERNIPVTNIPSYSTDAVAQHTFALLLHMTNQVARYSEGVMKGDWVRSVDFSYLLEPLGELQGKTMGIIGMGRIGQRVARIAESFGMKVVTLKRKYREGLSFDELLEESDVVSLHCPLTEETKGLMNYEAFKKMKPSSLLINTSRGPLVVEEDLVKALNEELIRGAALDVIDKEPMVEGSVLLEAKNLTITPHIAWAASEARERLMVIAVENIQAFLEGREKNRVN